MIPVLTISTVREAQIVGTALEPIEVSEAPMIAVELVIHDNFIDISTEGFGYRRRLGEPREDDTVMGVIATLESRDGIPHLLVYADEESEQPTHSISLEKARIPPQD